MVHFVRYIMRNCVIYYNIPIQMEYFEELRADNDWAGIKSNYKPVGEDDDDDDDDW